MPKFRPILSAINAPGYNLAKFLIPILEPLTHNEFTVKDSFSFAKEITKYDSSLFMASLDVESLFTNIPLKETINNCVKDLHNKNVVIRCYSLCSDYTLFHLDVEKLREILKKNSYPSSIIELSIRTFLNRLYVPKQVYSTAPKKELLIILPFLRTMSSNLKQKLQTSIRNSLPQCNIKVILKSTNHLSSLFRFKDVIPKELKSHLVYKFSCSSCNATYYGKTERHLNVRSGEHIGLSPLTGNRVACKLSAISDHLLLQ